MRCGEIAPATCKARMVLMTSSSNAVCSLAESVSNGRSVEVMARPMPRTMLGPQV